MSVMQVRVEEWPLGPNGLLHDREWALVGDDGTVFTQKTLPKLALIQPSLDLQTGNMQVGLQHDCLIDTLRSMRQHSVPSENLLPEAAPKWLSLGLQTGNMQVKLR